jgi:hypothetical protein
MLHMFAVLTYHLSLMVFEIKDEELLKIEHMVKLQILGNNSKTVNNIKSLTWGKNDQHSKIYLTCNF